MLDKKNTNIKCNVASCKYNDCDNDCCSLDEIQVSCNCRHDAVSEKDSTICASFVCKQ